MKDKAPQKALQKKTESIAELLKSLGWALLIALVIRTVAFESYRIPSGSMYPTNHVGDFLFVNKFCYGYTKYSLLFSPNIFSGRIFFHPPERGDVIVFRLPRDTSTDYIKRLVGLPGDRLQVKEGVLHINGDPVQLEQIGDFDLKENGVTRKIKQFVETLPNGVRHKILKSDAFGQGRMDNTVEYTVPPKHYFMMGDNRDNSVDSRYISEVGFVPEENLIGRAEVTYFSIDLDSFPFSLRFKRFFSLIR